MTKAICFVFACAFLLAVFSPAVIIAQTPADIPVPVVTLNPADSYRVEREGETLWDNARNYKEVLALPENKNLKTQLYTRDGRDILIWHVGDVVYGVKKVVSSQALQPGTSPKVEAPVLPQQVQTASNGWMYILGWLLVAGIVIFLLLRNLNRGQRTALSPQARAFDEAARDRQREEEQRAAEREAALSNPTTSGPPMVPGGVNDTNVADHFLRSAQRDPLWAGSPLSSFRIISMERGRGYGIMNVHYGDGQDVQEKRLNGEIVYRALVEFPNGERGQLYMLQACGNDIRYTGRRYQPGDDFRFEPIHEVVPTAAAPTPAMVAAAAGIPRSFQGMPQMFLLHGGRVGIVRDGRAVAFSVEGAFTPRVENSELQFVGNDTITTVSFLPDGTPLVSTRMKTAAELESTAAKEAVTSK